MKSVNFQRNKALIRVVNEQKIKKQRNWDRILYLGLLGFFLIFVITMAYQQITKVVNQTITAIVTFQADRSKSPIGERRSTIANPHQ